MYDVIKYVALKTRLGLSKRLGERGAEMVEYAIVLACIAALGVTYYKADGTASGGKGTTTLNGILTDLWNGISDKSDTIIGTKK